ncbi:MAG: hypothetical protein WC832_01910 [Anaerolineales bacterium]
MRKFFTVIARFIATIFAILFMITTILALLLTTINRQMLNANLYKNALAEQNIYEHLPEIVGVALTSSFISYPCAQNQLACNIEGASPELQACLTTALGPDAYGAIGSGQRSPTNTELQLAQPCLDQYGSHQIANGFQPGETLPNASPDVQACVKQAIGEQAYNELFNNQRPSTETENQRMSPCFAQSGTGSPGGGSGMPPFMQTLTAADWQAILTILLPPDDLQTMTESTLDQMFAYLNGETDTVTVPLDKLIERLTGPAGIDLIMQLINSQPPCTGQELAQMASGPSNGGLVLCKPPEFVLPIVVSLVQELLNAAATQLPDKATIIKPPSPGTLPSGTGPFGADPITTIRMVRLMMSLSPLLPLAFLLLVTLFAVRSLKSWMRWWGIPIFVSGTIALGLGISALPAENTAWTMFIVPRIPPFIPADIAGIGLELVRSIVHTITEGIVLQAIILLAFGLAAWIGSSFIKTKNEPDVPVTPPMPTP